MVHPWMCDTGQLFENDDGLARRLASRLDEGDQRIMFSRDGCMFRLTYEDKMYPPSAHMADYLLNRTYTVTLTNYSPSCAGEHVFAATWPEAYTHHPVQIVANDAPEDAPVIADGTMKDVSRVLTSIGVVLWPELYHL